MRGSIDLSHVASLRDQGRYREAIDWLQEPPSGLQMWRVYCSWELCLPWSRGRQNSRAPRPAMGARRANRSAFCG